MSWQPVEPVQDCAGAHPARSSTPNNPVSRHSSAWRLSTHYFRDSRGSMPCRITAPTFSTNTATSLARPTLTVPMMWRQKSAPDSWMATCDKLAALPQASAPSHVQLGIRNFASRLYRSNCLDIPIHVLVLKFDEPIELAKGKPLRTLRDAGEYVTAQPKADPKTARAGARRRCSTEIRCPS